MMNNKRIASELKRVAKSLVASEDVANTEGEYENFTGTIDWKGSKGQVTRAFFKLYSRGIVWKGGIWINGTWEYGIWHNGIWLVGSWEDGIWVDGKWQKGDWWDGTWKDGNWEEGVWKNGTWKGGIWKKGKDKKGKRHLDSPDNW